MVKQRTLIDKNELDRKVTRISHEIIERNRGTENLAIVGIKTRGQFLAERIAEKIADIENKKVPVGAIDITLYRDDFRNKKKWPLLRKTEIDFRIEGVNIVLVDDVIFTGRTIRAAIGVIMDFGRPLSIQLAVLVDRGHRELPIQPDYTGINISTELHQKVSVYLMESDGQEKVVVEQ